MRFQSVMHGSAARMAGIMAAAVVFAVTASMAAAEEGVDKQRVTYTLGELEMVGYLTGPTGDERGRPGVVVVHEWWGLNSHAKHQADRLADAGYVVLAADMYGGGRTTESVEEAGRWAGAVRQDPQVMRQRVAAAVETLRRDPRVDARRIAVIGYCFGGTVALELARSGADVAGVVSFHGGLATTLPAQPDALRARVLVLHGADDPMVPPEQVAAFEQEMRNAKADWTLVSYGGAVHSFTNPKADELNIPGVAYHRLADQRSWQHMIVFFDEIFTRRSGSNRP